MSFDSANEAKADFENVYTAETPQAYIATMAKNGYEIGERARPYCTAAAEFLRERNTDAWPVQMLDVGCSYGLGSAFVKFGCSFDEMVAFYASRAPRDYRAACESTRTWLNVAPPVCDVRTVGLDCSRPAIRFAVDAGLLDGGIARNLEGSNARPTQQDRAWFRSCNLLISTGAIGYVTERTLDPVLAELGHDHPGHYGPFAVVTVLRMFDIDPIHAVFEKHGLEFDALEGVLLPQRRFADDRERREVLEVLHGKGVNTDGLEDDGRLYAGLYLAGPRDQLGEFRAHLAAAHAELEASSGTLAYIRR